MTRESGIMNPTRYRPSSACRNLLVAGVAALGWAALAGIPASATTQHIPLADLVPSVGALRMQVNGTSTIRVTISNQGGAYARRPWVRMYLHGAVQGRKWGELLSATGATCTQDGRRIDCRLHRNLDGGTSRVIALNMRIDDVRPSDRHELHVHADCGPNASHHNGGEIPESNESNNILVRRATIHRPPDLEPIYMNSSFQNEVGMYVYKLRDTTLTFGVTQRERFVSASNVKVTVATPNIDIKTLSFRVVDSSERNLGSRGFVCSPSNSAPQIVCRNGTLNWQDTLHISAVARAKLLAPTVLSPVIVTVDPDQQIEEWNETNNIKTYNIKIQ
jgi:hypothetical protein